MIRMVDPGVPKSAVVTWIVTAANCPAWNIFLISSNPPGRVKIDSLKMGRRCKVRAIMGMADIRRNYSLGALNRADLDANPLAQFNQWFTQASAGGRWRRIGIALFKLWHAVLGHS